MVTSMVNFMAGKIDRLELANSLSMIAGGFLKNPEPAVGVFISAAFVALLGRSCEANSNPWLLEHPPLERPKDIQHNRSAGTLHVENVSRLLLLPTSGCFMLLLSHCCCFCNWNWIPNPSHSALQEINGVSPLNMAGSKLWIFHSCQQWEIHSDKPQPV